MAFLIGFSEVKLSVNLDNVHFNLDNVKSQPERRHKCPVDESVISSRVLPKPTWPWNPLIKEFTLTIHGTVMKNVLLPKILAEK